MLEKRRPALILASASPRRQDLLRQAGIAFEAHPAHLPEERNCGEAPVEYACRVSSEKAQTVARKFPGRYILGADTIVVLGQDVLGKPASAEDAARMLRRLSARMHEVVTAVSLIVPGGGADTRFLATDVYFRDIVEEEIARYVATGEPFDKAGAYAIQGGASCWVRCIKGDYSNVVGLPLALVTEMLRSNRYYA